MNQIIFSCIIKRGRIEIEVARRATGCQIRVIACDPAPSDTARGPGVEFVPLDPC